MTTTPIAAGPLDVTVRTRFEQWYLRELRGNPANLELEESGEYKYLPTLFLAFEAGEKAERETCAKIAEQETRLARTSLSNILGDDGVIHCHVAAAIRARSNAKVSGAALTSTNGAPRPGGIWTDGGSARRNGFRGTAHRRSPADRTAERAKARRLGNGD